jgi:hypothetical protein
MQNTRQQNEIKKVSRFFAVVVDGCRRPDPLGLLVVEESILLVVEESHHFLVVPGFLAFQRE